MIYKEIISYCKDLNKTIVIDCAQFHCIKDINILKGKIIAIRTSINTCYERVVKRFIEQKENYIEEELIKYQDRKKAIFKWYKFTNKFLEKINNLL